MSITAFTQVLTTWLWLSIVGAGVLLSCAGPQERFWFLLISALATWAGLWFLDRHFDPDGSRQGNADRNDRSRT